MRFPNWLRIAWWAGLTALGTWFLSTRLPALRAGTVTAVDSIVLVVWIVLLLAPVYQEVTFLGLSAKQEIKALKEEVKSELSGLRAELHSAVGVRTTVSPTITVPILPSDAQLPAFERVAKEAARQALEAFGAQRTASASLPPIEEDVLFLFATRYGMERELERIRKDRALTPLGRRVVTQLDLTRLLEDSGLISDELGRSIRQVYGICSAAIHAHPVTAAQVEFVRDVAPDLLAALRAIS